MIKPPQTTGWSTPAVAAAVWQDQLMGDAMDCDARSSAGYSVRAFNETPKVVIQPVLVEDIVCLHRGGAKRVHRGHDCVHSIYDIEDGALTLMPRGQANRWQTFGPIEYVHLTLNPGALADLAAEAFEDGGEHVSFCDDVGFRDPVIEPLFHELIVCSQQPPAGLMYRDALLAALTCRLLLTRSSLSARHRSGHQHAVQSAVKGGLPDWRLRRIADYLRDHLADDITLAELSGIAGVSRAHLFRAFRQSTGSTPVRYLTDMRLKRARELLLDGVDVDEVVCATGFTSSCRLSAAYRRHFGLTPKQFARGLKLRLC